jgi:hypothetical protein
VLAAATVSTAAALVLGGAAAANAATPPPAPEPTPSSCTFAQHLVHDWFTLPKALRTDLKAARNAGSRAERRHDLKAIRGRALAGDYGKAVKARAEHRERLDLRPLPDALKADLKTLRKEPTRAARLQEAGEIAQKALAGDYGDTIRELAERVQSSPRWQSCTPRVSHGS